MLTPDQLRFRLDEIREAMAINEHVYVIASLISLLEDVLPDLVASPIHPQRTESRKRDTYPSWSYPGVAEPCSVDG